MKLRIALAVALTLGIAAVLTAPAGAAQRAKSAVTIKYNGDGFQGKVKSKRSSCVRDRTVVVYKQHGTAQDPSSDQRLFKDTSDSSGAWDTGTSGQAHGKFYARVRRTSRCKAASSPTIKT
jgi:hypothetical protein